MAPKVDFRKWGVQMRRRTPEYRFWFKVRKTPTCWIWQGHKNPAGYGLIAVRSARTKSGYTSIPAPRFLYEMLHGPIGDRALLVCHHCDNPPCVRPDHLFLGTSGDNIRDAQSKGRMPTRRPKVLKGPAIGERHRSAKLKEAEVMQIREVYASGFATLAVLGASYGINQAGVSRIVNGKTWRHLLAGAA